MSENTPNKEKKVKTKDTATRIALIKSITAIICVIALCVTTNAGIAKIAEEGGFQKVAVSGNGSNGGDDNGNGTNVDPNDGTDNPGTTDPGTDDPGTTDPGTDDPGTTDAPGSTDNPSSNGSTKTTTTKAGSSVPKTVADVLKYFNDATSKVVSSKAGYKKKRVVEIKNLEAGALGGMKIVQDTVNNFLGVGTKEYAATKGKTDSPLLLKTSTLAAGDVSSATCSASGTTYTIVINVKNGNSYKDASKNTNSSPLDKSLICTGTGDKSAYDHKAAHNLYDTLNGEKDVAVEAAKESYSGAVITAKIDSATGKFISCNVKFNFAVDLTKVKYLVVTIKTATGNATTNIDYTNFSY